MYSMGACAALRKSNQDALSDDLESDPFLNSALRRFMCELCYRCGSFLAPLSVGLITSITCQNVVLKMEEQMETMAPNKYKGLRAAMAAELMIGFLSGIGAILTIRIVDSLD